ncbi:hypothetical protein ACFLYO_00460 [Chloroflexota bacterium]
MPDNQNENSLIRVVQNMRLQYECQKQDDTLIGPAVVFKKTKPEDVEKKAFLDVLVSIAIRISKEDDKEGDE